MTLWQKIVYFFRFTIPEQWTSFKEWWKSGSIMFKLAIVIGVFIVLPLTVYKSYLAYNQANQARQERIDRLTRKRNINVSLAEGHKQEKVILKNGPKKYLREQLDVDTDAQVIDLFNQNLKYHGKYREVVANASDMNDINEFRNYLNKVVYTIQNGESIQASKINHKFKLTTNPSAATQDDLNDGVMIIAWDSKASDAKQQAQKIDKIVDNAKDYKCYVYDVSNQAGVNNFSFTLAHYIYMGDQIRDGYDESNWWSGNIYGFKNGLFTYHSTSLDNTPAKMPTASLANPKIKNYGTWLNYEI